jgi:CBS domain-containing protein
VNNQKDISKETSPSKAASPRAVELGDFTTTWRVLPISLLAMGIGVLCAFVALVLLRLIGLFTNLFYFGRWSTAMVSPVGNHLGIFSVLIPVAGALVIGVMARYGSERIRGHGIPEAIEAILMNGSQVEPKVALLKPLSSAISIGSGGPFGAEGPIIMTGGAFGSMIAQLFHLTSAERKTLLVAGAAGGMSATFASPVAAVLLAVELLLFEWKPRSLIPVALASAVAAVVRRYILGFGPLFQFELTHDANVFLPLLVGSVIAHGFTVLTLKRSILTEKVARRGFHLSREYAVDPLELLYVREVMETEILALPVSSTLGETLLSRQATQTRTQRLLPVVDGDGRLVGVLTRGDIQKRVDEKGSGTLRANLGEMVRKETIEAHPEETLRAVVYRMADTGMTRMPVVERGTKKLLGIVSLDNLLKARARHLEEERRREQVLRFSYFSPGGALIETARGWRSVRNKIKPSTYPNGR